MLWNVALLLAASVASGAPDLRGGRQAGGLTVYPDDRRASLYYYGPGDLGLAVDSLGRPDVHFLQTRYTGTAAAGDQGAIVFRSLLSLRVRQLGVGPAELDAARRALGLGRTSELRPLPIQKLEAALVYAPLRAGDGQSGETTPEAPPSDTQAALPAGHFENAPGVAGPDWTERIYVLALDPATAQLFWDSLHEGRVVLSLGYAFFALGSTSTTGSLEALGGGALGTRMRQMMKSVGEGPNGDAGGVALVRAGATAVTVDAERWPDLFRRLDVNDSLPPAYAVLDIYCYDFNNALRPDLYEKQVEVEATAVGGGVVTLLTTFQASQSDLYARGLRFPVAVRLDRSYRYRVTEIGLDGSAKSFPWMPSASWGRVLDVTSLPPEPVPGVPGKEQS